MEESKNVIVSQLTERESKALYVLKAFSIFSVITAHVNIILKSNIFSNLMTAFWNLFGTIGVFCFFLLGGFFYRREEKDSGKYWKKKFFTLILPWLLCATLTYAIAVLSTRQISALGYLKWVLGSGSLYYYVPVFLIFLLIFKYFYKHNWCLIICIVVNLASLLIYAFDIDYCSAIPFLTKYLNPLNWIGFFALGILVRKYRWDRIIIKNWWIFCIAAVSLIALFIVMWKFNIDSYFHIVTPFWACVSYILLLGLAYLMADYKIAIPFVSMGRWSYGVYLLHMQIVQFIISRFPINTIFVTVNPIFCFVLMYVLMLILVTVILLIPKGEKLLLLIGINDKKKVKKEAK